MPVPVLLVMAVPMLLVGMAVVLMLMLLTFCVRVVGVVVAASTIVNMLRVGMAVAVALSVLVRVCGSCRSGLVRTLRKQPRPLSRSYGPFLGERLVHRCRDLIFREVSRRLVQLEHQLRAGLRS